MKQDVLELLVVGEKRLKSIYNDEIDKSSLDQRIKDNQLIYYEIEKINFVQFTNRFENYQSLCGTLFDGKTMYYNIEKFSKFDHIQQCIIILNEFFNVKQGYYYSGESITSFDAKNTRSVSLLCLYHIGILPPQYNIRYGEYWRNHLYDLFISEPHNNLFLFEPTRSNSMYLLHDLVVNENEALGIVSNKTINGNNINCEISHLYLDISYNEPYKLTLTLGPRERNMIKPIKVIYNKSKIENALSITHHLESKDS